MHGVKRSAAPTASARAARKEKEAAKLQSYREIEDQFFSVRDADQLDEAALHTTTTLLALNPEFYTAWNYRRRILSHLFTTGPPPPPQAQEKPDFFAAARIPPTQSKGEPHEDTSSSSPSLYQLTVKTRLLEEDLELTTHALRAHPKVYWIWNHRKWCLIQMPDGESTGVDQGEEERIKSAESKWKREMRLVDKMLDIDPRNFHGWDYRRYLISQISLCSFPTSLRSSSSSVIPPFPSSLSSSSLPPSIQAHHLSLAQSELAYTLRKIESNFSNFSAWHWRSKLLPHVWASSLQNHGNEKREGAGEKKREEELNLVRQALYTDPDDQSVWLYHAWLVNLELDAEPEKDSTVPPPPKYERKIALLQGEINSIQELLAVEPENRYCLEALARYKTRLAHISLLDDYKGVGEKQDPTNLQREVQELLTQLVHVDPDRAGRYRDLMGKDGVVV